MVLIFFLNSLLTKSLRATINQLFLFIKLRNEVKYTGLANSVYDLIPNEVDEFIIYLK